MKDDPTSVLAGFVEAWRKNKVTRLVSFKQKRFVPFTSKDFTIKTDVPCLFFDASFQAQSIDGTNTIGKEAVELIGSNAFRLPYEQCFIILETPTQPGQLYGIAKALTNYHLGYFSQDLKTGIVLVIEFYKLGDQEWKGNSAILGITSENGKAFNSVNLMTGTDYDADEYKAVLKPDIMLATWITNIMLLSKTRMVIQSVLMPGTFAIQVNQGRVRANLKPLGDVIKIDLSAPRYLEQDQREGSEKCPHDRRGHYRVCASGKKVFVRSSKIKGGRDKAAMYVVTT